MIEEDKTKLIEDRGGRLIEEGKTRLLEDSGGRFRGRLD